MRSALHLFASFVLVASACSSSASSEDLTVDEVLEPIPESVRVDVVGQIEEHVRACMAEDGFEYIPYPQPRYTTPPLHDRNRSALIVSDHREFVEEFGYGLTIGSAEPVEHFSRDPNLEISRSLAGDQALAYRESMSRCSIEAQEEAGIDHIGEVNAQLSRLIPDLEAEILSDPRLAEATETWSQCMSERGHAYAHLAAPRDDHAAQLESVALDLETPEEAQAIYAELQRAEVGLALDDLDCREDSGVDEILPIVTEDVEAAFADRHRDLLEEVYNNRPGS